MIRPFTFLAAVTCTALLSGCLIPERFTAKVTVQPDTSYTLRYSGTAMHAMAAAQLKQTGSLPAETEKGLSANAEAMKKDPDVRAADYKGKARFELEIESNKKPGKASELLGILSVRTDKDGVMTISSLEIKEKDKRELEKIGLSVDGTLEVKLPRNAEVVSSNATSSPTLGFGSYKWKIGQIDQRPLMKIKFKAAS